MNKPSFKQQMLVAREEAIIQAANRALAEKGFDLMTLEEVAQEVGISKASLYKHFESKEELAAAAMASALGKAHAFVQSLNPKDSAIDKLHATVRWVMQLALAGDMPSLPSQNSSLRATLARHRPYTDTLMAVSDTLGEWIEAAQAKGKLNPNLPPIVILYTLYARACDPVLEFLKMAHEDSDEQILDWVMSTCFDGLASRKAR
jgi:TetR/AcrR family transcriptional regulator, regulator of autoinduction and epiphytic fitness